jgi:hypothetical protein
MNRIRGALDKIGKLKPGKTTKPVSDPNLGHTNPIMPPVNT